MGDDRGNSAALGRIAQAVKGSSGAGQLRATVMHAQSRAEAHLLAAQISADHPGAEVAVIPFSSVMVAHTGPGLVGAAWWRNDHPERSSAPLDPAA